MSENTLEGQRTPGKVPRHHFSVHATPGGPSPETKTICIRYMHNAWRRKRPPTQPITEPITQQRGLPVIWWEKETRPDLGWEIPLGASPLALITMRRSGRLLQSQAWRFPEAVAHKRISLCHDERDPNKISHSMFRYTGVTARIVDSTPGMANMRSIGQNLCTTEPFPVMHPKTLNQQHWLFVLSFLSVLQIVFFGGE